MNDITQAVIFAGGLGERLKPFTETNPKPMYPFNGKPFLEYLIIQIRDWGIKDIIILLGYLHEKVEEYFGNGSAWDVNIRYVVTPVAYDTGYRLKAAEQYLNEFFLMMYCDNICPIDFELLKKECEKNNALIQVTAYSNDDSYTKNNMIIREDGLVELYDKNRKASNLKGVDIGYAIVSRDVLSLMSPDNENFEAVVYPKIVEEKRLYATVTKHRYYSIGSYERINLTAKYLSGIKYIFLDRDGVINERPPKAEYICKPADFKWLPGAMDALKKLSDSGYFIILISNQAGIARGIMTDEDFWNVQAKLSNDLEKIGVKIGAVYRCPHGWEDNCECRKPKPGMLYQAQKDYSINLTECVVIGDDERDILTAHNANMKGILVTNDYSLNDAVTDLLNGIIKDYEVKDL